MRREGARRDTDTERWRSLVTSAPMAMAVVSGEPMRLEAANAAFCLLVEDPEPGASLRDALTLRLGSLMIEALDAVRETGAGRQDTLQLDDRHWTVWFERLGAEQVGVYGLRDGNVNHELLHALCNPIHGIRSATRILVRRQLDEETRKILEEIEGAAERAEACLKRLVVRP